MKADFFVYLVLGGTFAIPTEALDKARDIKTYGGTWRVIARLGFFKIISGASGL
jgi:hypothetical protein